MLTFCALLFFGLSGPRAQVAYNFQPPDNLPLWTGGYTTGYYTVLTMDCLAANGYGQWTSSNSTENSNGYPSSFLLANVLTNSATATDEVQTGVLATKEFQYNGADGYPTEAIKCAANLKGNVRYVWLDNTSGRDAFYVEGFDPGPTGGASGIDISFKSISTTSAIVKDIKANLCVEGVIPFGHSLVSPTKEPICQDMFDIAIDASYLYIVWEEYAAGTYNIYAAAINLTGIATVTQLGLVATGRRPTVGVDMRHFGSIANIDVAYINSGAVTWNTWVSGTTWTLPVVMPPGMYYYPWTWTNATHARIVDASTATGSTDKVVYFMAEDPSGNTALFLNRIIGNISYPDCYYCDGVYNTTRSTNSPIETTMGFPVMDDYIRAFADPYEGASGMGNFKEFHCLYILDHSSGDIPIGSKGGSFLLMIIPNYSPGDGYCVSGDNTAMHLFGLFPYYDPIVEWGGNQEDLYVAAVNQMGVHVHWTADSAGANIHYYRRDRREFDQDIEENTLLTDTCDIGNTESGVGTSSPTVLPNLNFTFYSDPSTDWITADYVWTSSLDFDNSATLNIGSSMDARADFVTVGSAYNPMNWGWEPGHPSVTSNSWTVTFGPDNSLDYYDYGTPNFFGNGQFTLTGTGETLSPNGAPSGYYVSNITHPAKWIIHNTDFVIYPAIEGDNIDVTATDAIFDFVGNGPYVYAGYLCTFCNGSYTDCQFLPDPSSTWFDFSMDICGFGTWDGTTGTGDGNYDASDYFSAQNHTVTFTSCYATTGIDIGGFYYFGPYCTQTTPPNYISPPAVTVTGGLYENVGIIAGVGAPPPFLEPVSPWWPISITGAAFDHINGQGIFIELGIPANTPQTYSVTIDNNDFKKFNNTYGFLGEEYYTALGSAGIFVADAPDPITGLPTSEQDALREAIEVSSNTFEAAGGEEAGSIGAAIHFVNTTGNIGYNNITPGITSGSKYQRGIWNESLNAFTTPELTWTLICDNKISGLTHNDTSTALETDWYTGYVKLDTFEYCSLGQLSGYKDNGHIIFSTYANNTGPGYMGTLNSITDLAGVHHDPISHVWDDDPAYDTLTGNNSGGAQIMLSGTAKVYLGLEPGAPSWSVYGDNTIVGSPDISSVNSVTLGDLSNNFWGGGTYSLSGTITASGGYLSSAPIAPGWYVCSGGLGDIAKTKGATALSFLKFNTTLKIDSAIDTMQTPCGVLLADGYEYESEGAEPQGYDTLRAFLENCPFYTNSWDAFNMIGGAAEGWIGLGDGTWPDFLAFLKQVLYLNPDTNWYCNDVGDMIEAVQNEAAEETICQYIIQSGKCPGLTSAFQTMYNSSSFGRHMAWQDSLRNKYGYLDYPPSTVGWDKMQDSINADTLANPYDTTVPTLWQEDLQILLGPQYAGVQPVAPITAQALLSAQLLENPVNNGEIDISFQMGRTALVTMELRDVLGRMVPLTYAKYQLEQPGQHNASIPAPTLPAGTYYLRIITDTGDAITLKLVKE